MKAMSQQGFTPKLTLLTTGYDPKALGAGLTGTYTLLSSTPYLGPISQLAPAAQQFRQGMAKYAPTTGLGLYGVGGWRLLICLSTRSSWRNVSDARQCHLEHASGERLQSRWNGADQHPVFTGNHSQWQSARM